jgi:2-phospho-L-lactate guanylyltransferase
VASVHVLVPLKRLDAAKTRLAAALEPEARRDVMRAMLAVTLGAVRPVGAATLVSSDPAAASLAAQHDVSWWDDRGLSWNAALTAAMREVVKESVVAVVSADLPLVATEDVQALVTATPARGVAIARARDGGTNAVSMRPPGVIMTCFGVSRSAACHAEIAAAAGVDATVVDREGLALDLDTPEDAEHALAAGGRSEALELLARTLRPTVPA